MPPTKGIPNGAEIRGHHIWCNKQFGPIADCRFCKPPKGLWDLYPYESEVEEQGLMGEHFPRNRRVT